MNSFAPSADTPPISPGVLRTAVESGLLTADQAHGLCSLEKAGGTATGEEPVDDEQFRLIGGFGDIFVTIGIALFLGGLAYFANALIGGIGTGVVIALASWLLAEYFTRNRRMALPSVVLLLVYVVACFFAIFAPYFSTAPERSALPLVIAGLVTAAAAGLHYWRFRVPVTIAAGAAALVATTVGLVSIVAPAFVAANTMVLLLLCGLVVFAVAMRFDMSDPQRLTRRTDIAFWLHMLAAPLIVHPLIKGLTVDVRGLDAASAWGILSIFVGLAVVALLVDRRAILVSGLSYAGIAFGTLIVKAGMGASVVPLTILVLGGLVLLLSAGWHALRRALLPLLPRAMTRALPPIAYAKSSNQS